MDNEEKRYGIIEAKWTRLENRKSILLYHTRCRRPQGLSIVRLGFFSLPSHGNFIEIKLRSIQT
jgi:hypothetical protein